MRAVVVTGPDEKDWRETDIAGNLADLQARVGGLIEALPVDSSKASVILNEEGKLLPLPVTAIWTTPEGQVLDVLRGPLVLLGPVSRGKMLPLTDEALVYIKQIVRPAPGAELLDALGVRPSCEREPDAQVLSWPEE